LQQHPQTIKIVYVNATGSIKFTQAHSAGRDANSTATGWEYHPSITKGFGQLTWDGQHGFLACPDASTHSAYSIKVFNATGQIQAGCQQIDLLVPENTDTGSTGIDAATAWQYT
jgi:hypothetical protein